MSTELRVLRHESDLGRWELVMRAPEPRLRSLVCDYQGYVESGAPAPLRQQVPTPRIPLIVNFGAPWNVGESASGPPQPYGSFVAGLGERSSYVAAAGPASCVQVDLTPLGAHMFLGVAMGELANRVVGLADVLPVHARDLTERLHDKASWEARFELLDEILVARLAQARRPSPEVSWAWSLLERTNGRAPIGWICDRLGRSRRHLASRFREQVGLAPKTVARIMRFDHAVSLMRREGAALAQVAFESGYYDQAHLNRDFREFAGTSPAAFARRMTRDGGAIVAPTV
jgi:AraC-like DNA-binding protein